jgi:luciferase family oxidoreductase group 1
MVRFSILDLCPVSSGSSVGSALRASMQLATRADELGFHRYWVAEHHNMPGIASSSPAVLLGHLAMVTKRIRLGSGGVMLPNHAPLAIAEQFGMLEALHPQRIDLGIGRAPGTDPLTARALRGTRLAESDDFVARFGELLGFFRNSFPPEHPYSRIVSVPGLGSEPTIWILGSSDYGAQLAGQLGMPYSFAHHFAGGGTELALGAYRRSFEPGILPAPYSMIGVGVVCAETEDEARFLAGASALSFLNLRLGRPSRMPTPEEAAQRKYTVAEQEVIDQRLQHTIIGTPMQVKDRLLSLGEQMGVDELMLTTATHNPVDRIRSFELIADALGLSPLTEVLENQTELLSI